MVVKKDELEELQGVTQKKMLELSKNASADFSLKFLLQNLDSNISLVLDNAQDDLIELGSRDKIIKDALLEYRADISKKHSESALSGEISFYASEALSLMDKILSALPDDEEILKKNILSYVNLVQPSLKKLASFSKDERTFSKYKKTDFSGEILGSYGNGGAKGAASSKDGGASSKAKAGPSKDGGATSKTKAGPSKEVALSLKKNAAASKDGGASSKTKARPSKAATTSSKTKVGPSKDGGATSKTKAGPSKAATTSSKTKVGPSKAATTSSKTESASSKRNAAASKDATASSKTKASSSNDGAAISKTKAGPSKASAAPSKGSSSSKSKKTKK